MVKWVSQVHESIPSDMALACDMHGRYDATTGKKVAKALEPFRLMWLEEPVAAEDIDAMADIRHSTSTPIACGENLYMRWGYRELLEKQAVDIIQPDFEKVGGLAEAQKVANMAQAYYIPVAPHCVVSPIGVMATAHACATFPNFLCCEWHWINHMDLWTVVGQGGGDHRQRLRHSARQARDWSGDGRGSCKEGPDSRNNMVRS